MPVSAGAQSKEANLNSTTPAAPDGYENATVQGGTPYTDPNNPNYQVADVTFPVRKPINGRNDQTGTTYTLQASDDRKAVVFNAGSSAVAVALPAPGGTDFPVDFYCIIENLGTGIVTLTPSGSPPDSTVNETTSVDVSAGTGGWLLVEETGSPLAAEWLWVAGGGGGGTVPSGTGLVRVTSGVLDTAAELSGDITTAGALATTLRAALRVRHVVFGGSVTGTGALALPAQSDFAGTIIGFSAFVDTGTIQLEVWKKASSAPPSAPSTPTGSDKISASAPIDISSGTSVSGGTSEVSTWATAVAAWDSWVINVSAVSGATKVQGEILVQQS